MTTQAEKPAGESPSSQTRRAGGSLGFKEKDAGCMDKGTTGPRHGGWPFKISPERMKVEISEWLLETTGDETAALWVTWKMAHKLMGEGRAEKGPLALATDRRTCSHFLGEVVDESADAVTYGVFAAVTMMIQAMLQTRDVAEGRVKNG